MLRRKKSPRRETESVQNDESAGDEENTSPYELLGIWDGFDAHTGLPGRNAIPVSAVNGEEIALYDVVYSDLVDKIADYIESVPTTISYDSVISDEKLPAGEYLVRFVVRDVFNTTHYTDFVPVTWDGETLSY